MGLFWALFVALMLLCSITHGCLARPIYGNYLQLPGDDQLISDPYQQTISEALLKLNIKPFASPQSVLDAIEFAKENESNRSIAVVYERLSTLASGELYCSEELINLSKSLIARIRLARKTTNNLKEIEGFFVHYGRIKFGKCASIIETNLQLLPGGQAVHNLNLFFTHAINESGTKFYAKMKALDMETDPLNLRGMALVARARPSHAGHLKDRPFTLIKNFLDRQCQWMNDYLARTLDIINIAFALEETKRAIPSKLLRRNEYNRICLAWRRAGTRQLIMANMKRQAEMYDWLLKPGGYYNTRQS